MDSEIVFYFFGLMYILSILLIPILGIIQIIRIKKGESASTESMTSWYKALLRLDLLFTILYVINIHITHKNAVLAYYISQIFYAVIISIFYFPFKLIINKKIDKHNEEFLKSRPIQENKAEPMPADLPDKKEIQPQNDIWQTVSETGSFTETIKFCAYCGRELPENIVFCPYCGKKIKKEKTPKKKAPKEKVQIPAKKIIAICAAAAVALFAGIYCWSYFSAVKLAEDGSFSKAGERLFLSEITRIHDPQLIDYIIAGEMYEDGEYSNAEKAFNKLENKDYKNSAKMAMECQYEETAKKLNTSDTENISEIIEEYDVIIKLADNGCDSAVANLNSFSEELYDQALQKLEEADYSTAYKLFVELGEYKDSNSYREILCPICKIKCTSDEYETLLKYLDSTNSSYRKITQSVLLSDNEIAKKFLEGKFYTKDKTNSFEFNAENNTYYLPSGVKLENAESNFKVYVKNSVLYIDAKGKTIISNTDKRCLKFTIIDENTIKIYIYSTKQTETFYRQ